ncbi:MAG: hypothetical protein KDD44_06280, partial [Bdellovibrionales bacterium]|nr:hypothetical protein [Bdellovibrionales bacterium]
LLSLAKHLRELGVAVSFSTVGSPGSGHSVLHSIGSGSNHAIHAANAGAPVVCSTLGEATEAYGKRFSLPIVRAFRSSGMNRDFMTLLQACLEEDQELLASPPSIQSERLAVFSRLFPFSEHEKRELQSAAPGRVSSLCPPVNEHPRVLRDMEEACGHLECPDDFVLQVGPVRRENNQLMVLKALEDDPIDVVLLSTGRDDETYLALCQSILRRGRTRIVKLKTLGDLPRYLRRCRALVHPTLQATGSLQVLECSQYCGSIIVAEQIDLEGALAAQVIRCDPLSTVSIRGGVLEAFESARVAFHAPDSGAWRAYAERIVADYRELHQSSATSSGQAQQRHRAAIVAQEEKFREFADQALIGATGSSYGAELTLRCLATFSEAKENTAEYQFIRGLSLLQLNELRDAQAAFEAVVRLDPFYDSASLVYLGVAKYRQGMFQEAARTFRRAAEWGLETSEEVRRLLYEGIAQSEAEVLDEGPSLGFDVDVENFMRSGLRSPEPERAFEAFRWRR